MKTNTFIWTLAMACNLLIAKAEEPTAGPTSPLNYGAQHQLWRVMPLYGNDANNNENSGFQLNSYWGLEEGILNQGLDGQTVIKLQIKNDGEATTSGGAQFVFAGGGTITWGNYTHLEFDFYDGGNNGVKISAIGKNWGNTSLSENLSYNSSEWITMSLPLPSVVKDSIIGMRIEYPNTTYRQPYYIDNIYLTRPADPQVAATTPAEVKTTNCLSVYGQVEGGTVIAAGWSGTGVLSDGTAENNPYKKLSLSQNNSATVAFGQQDISTKDALRMQLFAQNDNTSVTVQLKDASATSTNVTVSVEGGQLTPGLWREVYIPLSQFTGVTLSAITGIEFSGSGAVSIDNIYFSSQKVPTRLPDPLPDFTDQSWRKYPVYENGIKTNPTTNFVEGEWSHISIDHDYGVGSGNRTCVKVQATQDGGNGGLIFNNWTPIDLTATSYDTLCFDIWDAGNGWASIVALVDQELKNEEGYSIYAEVPITQLLNNESAWEQWKRFSFDLSNLSVEREESEGTTYKNIVGIKIVCGGNLLPYYLDNIYLTRPADPQEEATDPNPSEKDYITYRPVYTDVDFPGSAVIGTNITSTQIGTTGNYYSKIADLSQATTWGFSSQDLSDMDYLHLDLFAQSDNTSVKVTLNGQDYVINTTGTDAVLTPGQWVGVDIPMSSFGSSGLTNISSIQFSGTGAVSVDNVYFYSYAPKSPPTTPAYPNQHWRVFSSYGDLKGTENDGDFSKTSSTGAPEISIAINTDYRYLSAPGNPCIKIQRSGTTTTDNTNWAQAQLLFNDWAPINLEETKYDSLYFDIWDAGNWWANISVIVEGKTSCKVIELTGDNNNAVGKWKRIGIPLDTLKVGGAKIKEITGIRIECADACQPYYLDNIYFYRTADVLPKELAPEPKLVPAMVIKKTSDCPIPVFGNSLAFEEQVYTTGTGTETETETGTGTGTGTAPLSCSSDYIGVWKDTVDITDDATLNANIEIIRGKTTTTPEGEEDAVVLLSSTYAKIKDLSTPAILEFPEKDVSKLNALHIDLYLLSDVANITVQLGSVADDSNDTIWSIPYTVTNNAWKAGEWVADFDIWIKTAFPEGTGGTFDPKKVVAIKITNNTVDNDLRASTATTDDEGGSSPVASVAVGNVYFYTYTTNQNPVAVVVGANVIKNGAEFYTLGDAFDEIARYDQSGQKITVKVIRNSDEYREVTIRPDSYENMWQSLTIYPVTTTIDQSTITADSVIYQPIDSKTKHPFFNIYDAHNVTIDGNIRDANASEEKTGKKWKILGSSTGVNNADAAIYLASQPDTCKNITIEDCHFIGDYQHYAEDDPEKRPTRTIAGSGVNVTIQNNVFENSLCLTGEKTEEVTIAVIHAGNNEVENIPPSNNWKIIGNHFYENVKDANGGIDTEGRLTFDHSAMRYFIALGTTDSLAHFTVEGNVIGGSYRVKNDDNNVIAIAIADTMRFGSKVKPTTETDSVSTSLFPIAVWLKPVPEGKTVDTTIIKNNIVANIDLFNWTNDTIQNEKEKIVGFAEFCGIRTENGNVIVRGNTVKNVTCRSMEPKGVFKESDSQTGDTYSQLYIARGISCLAEGSATSQSAFVCDSNLVHNIRMQVLPISGSNNKKTVKYYALEAQANSYASGVVRDNRVLWGHNDQTLIANDSDIGGIDAAIKGNNAKIELYNNIAVLKEFKYPYILHQVKSINLLNEDTKSNNADAGIYCYNNIVFVPEKGIPFNSRFNAPKVLIGGMAARSYDKEPNNAKMNIFHNTVFISNVSNVQDIYTDDDDNEPYNGEESGFASAALVCQPTKNSSIDVWNNSFVNLTPKDGLVIWGEITKTGEGAINTKLNFDYNHYLGAATFASMNESAFWTGDNEGYLTAGPFDDWKFSNTSKLFDKYTEQDFHSRYVDPKFEGADLNGAVSIDLNQTGDNALINALNSLRSKLQPARFLGGRKTADAILGKTSLSNDANNKDFSLTTMSTPKVRRPYLPTMGAINTSFSNFWIGSTNTDWNTEANWGDEKVPDNDGDIVFAYPANNGLGLIPTVANDLVLANDTTVHDIYNDTEKKLDVSGNSLTITGYVGQERPEGEEYADYAKIDASSSKSRVRYYGHHTTNDGDPGRSLWGAAAQHIFPETFVGNKVDILTIDNRSGYFVLLHGPKQAPTSPTPTPTPTPDLEIANRFERWTHKDSIDVKNNLKHVGGLNCIRYYTTLKFSGPTTENGDVELGYQRIPADVIFNDSVYNLVVNSTKLITEHDSLFVINDLTITNNDKDTKYAFEIAADKFVKVDGLTTSKDTSNLIIKSDGLKPAATFIFSNGKGDIAADSVKATVEFYSKAYKGVDEKYRWQFFTSPVKKTEDLASDIFKGAWVRRWAANPVNRNPYYGTPYWIYLEKDHYLTSEAYDEGKGLMYKHNPEGGSTDDEEATSPWDQGYDNEGASNDGSANPQPVGSFAMQGYEITHPSPKTYFFKGALTNEDNTLELTYYEYTGGDTFTDVVDDENLEWDWSTSEEPQYPADGQYVVGNPYTASIRINKLEFSDNMEKTVYIFNTGSYQDWAIGGATDNSGRYTAVPKEYGSGSVGLPSEIPSMQGFVVMFNEGETSTATFSVKYNAATDGTVGKNSEPLRSAKSEPVYTLVDLSSGRYQDRLWLFTEPSCKKGFDNGWDGRKFVNETADAPAQLFTMEGADRYQVSTMDELDGTYLGIKPGVPGEEHTLTFTHSEGSGELWLTDLLEGRKVNVSESGSTYAFTVETAGEVQKRFLLSATNQSSQLDDETTADKFRDGLWVYAEGKTIIVENTEASDGWLTVYDASGKPLLREKATANKRTRIPTNLETGVYPVQFSVNNRQYQSKFIIF